MTFRLEAESGGQLTSLCRDWGPSMITCGPWKDARLEIYNSRIADLHVDVHLRDDLKSVQVVLVVESELSMDGLELRGIIKSRMTGESHSTSLQANTQKLTTITFEFDNPDLWWPAGHGSPLLYDATVSLMQEGNIIDAKKTKFGIRKIELVRRPLKTAGGETFFFRINNRSIFCLGTNWIPCHSLPALASPELYEKNLNYAVENNNNMLRIWGGGIYEHDAFYDFCDENGLMVWHDMMFACGIYPVDDWFHQSVTEELEAQIRRLRNHPCVTLWNGDNEVFFMYDRQGTPYDASVEKGKLSRTRTVFLATTLTLLGMSLTYTHVCCRLGDIQRSQIIFRNHSKCRPQAQSRDSILAFLAIRR